ncbi:MAG: hypothetical protein ABJH72_21575, partial [Reichenbachiella sp.]|uniref:hypothetical protein n=1 Tax=Reichenbachiella sp. TaxID=2184521 RepID=UPI00329A6E45
RKITDPRTSTKACLSTSPSLDHQENHEFVIHILVIPHGAVVLILALIRIARKGIRAYTMLATFLLFEM